MGLTEQARDAKNFASALAQKAYRRRERARMRMDDISVLVVDVNPNNYIGIVNSFLSLIRFDFFTINWTQWFDLVWFLLVPFGIIYFNVLYYIIWYDMKLYEMTMFELETWNAFTLLRSSSSYPFSLCYQPSLFTSFCSNILSPSLLIFITFINHTSPAVKRRNMGEGDNGTAETCSIC